jgi:hypothetical protein
LTLIQRVELQRGNSAHLLRHEKVFKCDLPGCTNTKGFARIDQLERHKREVKHNPQATWVQESTGYEESIGYEESAGYDESVDYDESTGYAGDTAQ